MFPQQLTEEQRLEKAITKLMSEPRLTALAGVIMIGKKQVCNKTPTASTNGRDEKYGRAFIHKQSDKQLRAVVLHEQGHKMRRDLITWRALVMRNHRRANRAADYVNNLWVKDEIAAGVDAQFWDEPAPLLDERFRGMNVQQVFNILEAEEDDDETGDDLGDHDWDDAHDMSEEEMRQLDEDIDTALRQGQMVAAKTGNASRFVGELLRPVVDWRTVLRQFMSDQCAGSDYTSWASPNRRYIGSDIIMPASFSDAAGDIIVAIDTSGSIQGVMLDKFLTEVKSVCETVQPRSVRILYWDTEVCRDEYYANEALAQLTQSTKPAGGGGTDAACVPAYIAQHSYNPKAVIVLTDGYVALWGSWSHPLLWCVVGSKRVPPVGKVVYVD
jgi:predicted metal-dependent peptidase